MTTNGTPAGRASGGRNRQALYGPALQRQWAKKGGDSTATKYGPEHFANLARLKAAKARRAKGVNVVA